MSIAEAKDISVAAEPPTEKQKAASVRRLLAQQLLLELALPLGGYYGLRTAGASEWLALSVGGALTLPWIVYGVIRRRRLDVTAAFTLTLLVGGSLMSLITGDPRVLLVRDSWLGALLGVWMIGSLLTRRPFIMVTSRAVVVAKLGEAGATAWEGRWDHDPDFRRHVRILTGAWGAVFLADAGVRVALAYSLRVDSVPAVSTAQWLVVLGCLLAFHIWYVGRHGLKA